MQRHLGRSLALGMAASVLLAVAPAAAKMPYFSVELSPPNPVDGEVLTVVVRMWDDAAHTQPASWLEELTIAGLLEFQGETGTVPIRLHRLDDSSYRAEVTLPAGDWRLVAFPMGVAVSGEGYPTPVRVTVSERWNPSTGAAIAVAGVACIIGVLVARQVRGGMRRRRLGSVTG